jgi:hypothetical protein
MACSLSLAPLARFACWRGRSTAGPSHYQTLFLGYPGHEHAVKPPSTSGKVSWIVTRWVAPEAADGGVPFIIRSSRHYEQLRIRFYIHQNFPGDDFGVSKIKVKQACLNKL